MLIFNFLAVVSVAEETGLSLTLSETPKTGFVVVRSNPKSTQCELLGTGVPGFTQA